MKSLDEIRFDKVCKTYEDHFGQSYGILMHDRRSLDEHIKIMEQALEDDKPVQNPTPPHEFEI